MSLLGKLRRLSSLWIKIESSSAHFLIEKLVWRNRKLVLRKFPFTLKTWKCGFHISELLIALHTFARPRLRCARMLGFLLLLSFYRKMLDINRMAV